MSLYLNLRSRPRHSFFPFDQRRNPLSQLPGIAFAWRLFGPDRRISRISPWGSGTQINQELDQWRLIITLSTLASLPSCSTKPSSVNFSSLVVNCQCEHPIEQQIEGVDQGRLTAEVQVERLRLAALRSQAPSSSRRNTSTSAPSESVDRLLPVPTMNRFTRSSDPTASFVIKSRCKTLVS